MHYEILIEDESGKQAMEFLIPKILTNKFTYRIIPYKGIGHIPKSLKPHIDANKRKLLNQLPRLLQGYGRVPNIGAVIVICDLDNKDKTQFLDELYNIINNCNPKPIVYFCLAIEEFEAWYLGDFNAIRIAFPNAKNNVLRNYVNDSICGTWELLADAICKGGRKSIKSWIAEGEQKYIWAIKISPHMDVDNNLSPIFCEMRDLLRNIAV